jgi:hypothetical protein
MGPTKVVKHSRRCQVSKTFSDREIQRNFKNPLQKGEIREQGRRLWRRRMQATPQMLEVTRRMGILLGMQMLEAGMMAVAAMLAVETVSN